MGSMREAFYDDLRREDGRIFSEPEGVYGGGMEGGVSGGGSSDPVKNDPNNPPYEPVSEGPPTDNAQPSWTLGDLRENAPPIAGATASMAGGVNSPTAAMASSGQVGQVSNAQGTDAFALMKAQQAMDGSFSNKATGGKYNARTGTVDPSTMMSAEQLNKITSQDSANMRRAAQQGMLSAASRGLQNSSIAAGAAQGAMVDRATPLAQQDAATYYSNMRGNVDAQNAAAAQNAQMATQASLANANNTSSMLMQGADIQAQISAQNAAAQNQLTELQAQLDTAVNQQNAGAINAIQQQMADIEAQISVNNSQLSTQTSQFNANSTNAMNQQVLQGNQALNDQFLRGEQAIDLAQVQGQYQQLLSTNEQAANMFQSYMSAIGSAMSNHENSPERIAQYVNTLATQLQGGLEFMDQINSIDFGAVSVPASSGTGGGGTYNPGNNIANNIANNGLAGVGVIL